MTMFRTALAGVCAAAAAGVFAQSRDAPQKVDVIAVAGCVLQEGANWFLTSATEPLAAPAYARGGRTGRRGGQTASGPGGLTQSPDEGTLAVSLTVTVEMANQQPPGKARYRLIGFLDEFGVASHKGHKVLVRGPLVAGVKEKRINVMSVTMVSPACGTAK
ncbi:MAG: hypothetical protein HYZ58_03860 [Acidobacteria bacterium]|nr:hypothetical protein [Acidobacteriota bacterium]MBI3262271.1 hypothetical protein [Acidobacteriota bacterium]